MSKEKSGQKLVHHIIKGSFHQGSLYTFDTTTAGHQCVPNCIVAAAYASIVPVSKWTGESLDCILHCGDALYKKVKTDNDFLQVHEIGKEIYVFGQTFKITIENEYYGTLQKDEIEKTTVGTTLEKVTYTMYHSLSQSKQYVYGVLCIGDHHGSSASLLCLSKSNIYIFDPHSVNMRGEPVSNGTSALLHFFSRTKMIQYLHKKYITNLSLIFNITIVQCTQTNQSIVNYFEDQRYQYFKTKNVDSKYEQNVSCTLKRDEKNMLIFISNIQGKWYVKRKKRSTKNVTMKRKMAI